MTEGTGTPVFEQIAAMEDDLARVKDWAVALISIASAHQRADIGQCGEHILEQVNIAYAALLKASASSHPPPSHDCCNRDDDAKP